MSTIATTLANVCDFLPLVLEQQVGRQQLIRVPEPRPVMDAKDSVDQYDHVMTTKLAIPYAIALEVIYRARDTGATASACDLASGPGHFTLLLAEQLEYARVQGIDLAEPMVDLATRNASKHNLDESVTFRVGDVCELSDLETNSFDLCCFADASHHLPDLATVKRVVEEMDRITSPSGLVFLMDIARLRTAGVTDRYVDVIGRDYVESGIPQFLEDFRDSMYAAWTCAELRSTVPENTNRTWQHLTPLGLPTMQIILGLPADQKPTFLRRGFPWSESECPVPKSMKWEWNMLRHTLLHRSPTVIRTK